jgi:hypothetical protein
MAIRVQERLIKSAPPQEGQGGVPIFFISILSRFKVKNSLKNMSKKVKVKFAYYAPRLSTRVITVDDDTAAAFCDGQLGGSLL